MYRAQPFSALSSEHTKQGRKRSAWTGVADDSEAAAVSQGTCEQCPRRCWRSLHQDAQTTLSLSPEALSLAVTQQLPL